MIRFIAAIDEKRGIANDKGIPWIGKIHGDTEYYRAKVKGFPVIMGEGLYKELSAPYPESTNYVVTGQTSLRPGFSIVKDPHQFLEDFNGDIWDLGGAMLYATTIDLADELYLTQLKGDFKCTKFFPEFKQDFEMISETEPKEENGIKYTFQVWKRK